MVATAGRDVLLAASASALVACEVPDWADSEGDRELPTYVAETEHFVLRSHYRQETYSAAWLEAQYQSLSEKLDFSLPKRIIYDRTTTRNCDKLVCEHEDAFEITCRGAGDFCPFYRARIYAEQVGDAPAFLRDALAEVIAGGLSYRYVLVSRQPASNIVDYFEDDHYLRVRASLEPDMASAQAGLKELHDQLGRFARTMIDEMTLDEFIDFYRSGSRGLGRWKPETGRSLEEWAATAAERTPASMSERGYRLAIGECRAPPINSGDVKIWEASLGEPRIYGPGLVWNSRGRLYSFALDERSDVTVRMRAPKGMGFAVEPCFFAPERRHAVGLGLHPHEGDIERTETLAPGAYFLFAGGYSGGAKDPGVTLRFRVQKAR